MLSTFSLKIPFTGRISEADCFIIVKFYKSLQPIKTKFSFHLLHSNTVCEYVKHHSICPVTILPTFVFCHINIHIQVLEIVYNLPQPKASPQFSILRGKSDKPLLLYKGVKKMNSFLQDFKGIQTSRKLKK